jgi:hypothetical protein
MAGRTPDEIRASIEQNRQELGASLQTLYGEVAELTDWRAQLRRNQQPLMAGAAGAGFVLGGGIAGSFGLVFGHRRRKNRRKAAKAAKRAASLAA